MVNKVLNKTILFVTLVASILCCLCCRENIGKSQDKSVKHFNLEEVASDMEPIALAPGPGRDLAVRELLFRYVIINHRLNVDVWFLDFGEGQDPPQEFLDRFSNMDINVKGVSHAVIEPLKGVTEANTNRNGAIARAKIIRWTGLFVAEVEYSYYLHGLAAGGQRAVIQYLNGNWQIVKILEVWQS